jgi:hypothetical protein
MERPPEVCFPLFIGLRNYFTESIKAMSKLTDSELVELVNEDLVIKGSKL